MKFNKIYIAALFLMTAMFVGCDDYEDNVEKSPEVSVDNPAVRFVAENATVIELDPNVSVEFTLTVTRDDETAALDVPVIVVTNTENSFIVPSSVTFAAGAKTANLTISATDDAPKVTDLDLVLKLDESFTTPYRTEYPMYYGTVVVTDWEQFATGSYFSSWYGQSYSQILQYSPILDQYRFPDLMSDGYHFVFAWDGASAVTPVPEKVKTGYVHSTYGMVSATTSEATYDVASKIFTFTREWTVDAGSFGKDIDTYTMD